LHHDLVYYHIIIDRFSALDIAWAGNPVSEYRYQPLPPGPAGDIQGSCSTLRRNISYQGMDLLHSV
jgi:hypothetical protein